MSSQQQSTSPHSHHSAATAAAAGSSATRRIEQGREAMRRNNITTTTTIPHAPYPPMTTTAAGGGGGIVYPSSTQIITTTTTTQQRGTTTTTILNKKSSLSSTPHYYRNTTTSSPAAAAAESIGSGDPPPPPSSTRSMVVTTADTSNTGGAGAATDATAMTRSSSLGLPLPTTTATAGPGPAAIVHHHHSDEYQSYRHHHNDDDLLQYQQHHQQRSYSGTTKLGSGGGHPELQDNNRRATTTAGAGAAAGGTAAAGGGGTSVLSPYSHQIQFCGRNLLASINCSMMDYYEQSDNEPPAPAPGAPGIIHVAQQQQHRHGHSRKRGPVILELRRLCVNHHNEQQHDNSTTSRLFRTEPICVSRSNPSLGTSLSSTCLQVAPSSALPPYYYDDNNGGGNDQRPPPIATGLSTGALCIHTFQYNNNENDDVNNINANRAEHPPHHLNQNIDPDSASSIFTPSIEYYHTPRYHRPATAVAWRPSSSPRQVAIGLVSSSSAASMLDPIGAGHAAAGVVGGGVGVGSGRRGVGSVMGSGVVAAAASAGLGGGGMAGSRADRGGGDRDHCCFIWDVEHQSASAASGGGTTGAPGGGGGRRSKSTPLYKLSHQIGVASLGWVLEGGQTLAVGGQIRNLHLYDLRVKGTGGGGPQQAPVSVYAHNFGVHGIEPDCHRPWQFATFCRAANEPVKLWDSRRMDSVLGEIKIYGTTNRPGFAPSNVSMTVSAVQWSQTEPGKLVVAVGDAIHEYDASTPGSRPTLINTVYAKEPVVDIALYPYSSSQKEKQQQQQQHYSERSLDETIIDEYFPKRMVTVHGDGTVQDLSRHTQAPVAISRRDGRVVHAFGRSLWIGPTNQGPSAMESLRIDEFNEDISAKMIRRARCQIASRYSMDTSSNIKILAEDGIQAEGTRKDNVRSQREGVLRLWSWIERVESLCSEPTTEDFNNDGDAVGGITWPAKGLIDAGAWRLLRTGDGLLRETDEEVFSEALSCMTYDSPGRRAALTSCGWAGKFCLENVLGECEELGEYERSAALACWHGDIGQAVEALERGAVYIRGYLNDMRHSRDPRISAEYAETLELVSLSVAGYRGGDLTSSTSGIWRRACANLLQRPDLSNDSAIGSRVAYIRSVLKFLVTLGSDNGPQQVIGDASLSLCDRVGFACRFLPRGELYQFVEKCIKTCQATGDIEGMTITGIEKEGIQILQSYVDCCADVQTAALVTSRVILPSDWTAEKSICFEWLDSYRTLLNSWQMWQSRAMLDVDRADLLRKVKAKQQATAGTTMGDPKQVSLSHRRIAASGRKPSGLRLDPDIQASVPAQLDARCNYCSSPLGLKNQDTHASQWLSKMKPILSCCQQCRKPLPRCAICMLSLGALNPYMELTKERSRLISHRGPGVGAGAGTIAPADDLSSLASLPFAEWFTWCMRCKHGGHAHHLVGWFAKFSVCPVSGCDCRCQFDGIQKLNRPALVAD